MTEASARRYPHDEVADLYDRVRPGYPDVLFDDIAAYANLRADARILEVGCGSGQATLPLAMRGYTIDCVEIGARMAAIARRKLAPYPRVTVIRDKFETATLPRTDYDLLMSAMAFHWIDPAIRFQLAHDLLAPGGVVALFWHRPVQTEISREFVEAQQLIYRRRAPELAKRYHAPTRPEDASTEYEQLIAGSKLFEDLAIRKHYAQNAYDTESYIELLESFSGHRLLPALQRRALLREIEALIRDEFSGKVIRETVVLLYLARAIRPA